MSSHLTKSGLRFIDFKKKLTGKSIRLFSLINENGLEATITNYGLRLISLMVPDKKGVFNDVVLGHRTLKEYMYPVQERYFGAIIGRYANRIADGAFELDGKKYSLEINHGSNHLHGGSNGFHKVVWSAHQISKNEIDFSHLSMDMEEGYPGNLNIRVNYKLTDKNELIIEYLAASDKITILNLTNHAYFNLRGEGNGTVDQHKLKINADYYTPVNEDLIPTGELAHVVNSPFDFLKSKSIGQDINKNHIQLKYGNGYDHNFVINADVNDESNLVKVAEVLEPESGRLMEVFTNEPGVQFYSGNFHDITSIGKNSKPHTFRSGFCLETQHFPDSPNQPSFPSTILRPGEYYTSKTSYKFSSSG